MTTILLCLALVGLALTPVASAVFMMTNNVHCAQARGTATELVVSDPPLHDHHPLDLRGNCLGIDEQQSGHLARYAVSDPLDSPRVAGELYLRAVPGEGNAAAQVCLSHQHGGWQEWTCGPWNVWGGTDWEHYENDEHHDLPGATSPQGIYVAVGISLTGTGTCDHPCNPKGQVVQAHTFRYNGQSSSAAKISDPGGATQYKSSDEFRSFTVHDPEGDDSLVLGGIPLTLTPGTRLTLSDVEIQIEYQSSQSGGNEWVISSRNGTSTVYVWHDGDGTWDIRHLDY